MTTYEFPTAGGSTIDIRTLTTAEQDAWYDECGAAGDDVACAAIRSIRPDLAARWADQQPEA